MENWRSDGRSARKESIIEDMDTHGPVGVGFISTPGLFLASTLD
jgi:hypothetical protein